MDKHISTRLTQVTLILASFAFSGCGFHNHAERKYVARILSNPNEFRVSTTQYDSVWSRAKRFITTYASRPIEVMNDSVIATAKSGPFDKGYGYVAIAHLDGDGYVIRSGFPGVVWLPFSVAQTRNAEIFTDYIKTGELPFPEMISK